MFKRRDGQYKDFEQFTTVMHNHLEKKDLQWVTLTTKAIDKAFQNIVAERTAKSATTPMQTDLNTFSERKVAKSSVGVSFH